jgi:chromosomal replication initiation ATPase DnaA
MSSRRFILGLICPPRVPDELRALLVAIANLHGITAQAMRGRGRKPYLVDARRDFCRAASSRGYTTPAIARAIDRDHTTVLHHLGWGQK